MSQARESHFRHWPPRVPRHLTLPQTNVFYNAEVSAARYPDKPFIVFYDTAVSFAEFKDEAERIAGFLQHECGVKAGDRVLLYMQNSPQWVLAFYGILRANAVVVPVNPMNRTDELRHYVDDCRATTAFVAQELLPQMRPLLRQEGGEGLQHLVVATYSDYLKRPTDLRVPDFVAAARDVPRSPGVVAVERSARARLQPGPLTAGPDDPCAMPYTSGTTGAPKGCVHTHRSVMSTLVGGTTWFSRTQDAVFLSALPFFHVTGLSGSMNGPMYAGATIVVLPRWDREAAAVCIQRYGVTTWQTITDDAGRFPGAAHAVGDTTCPACRSSAAAAPPCPKPWRDGWRIWSDWRMSRATACPRRWPPPTSTRRTGPSRSAWASRCSTSTRASSTPTRCASCRRARAARSWSTGRR